MDPNLKTIYDLINELKNASSPDRIADIRVRLASWKSWIGEQLIEAEMNYNRELNSAMTTFDLPATKATIKVKAGDTYRDYAKIKQLYNDLVTVISAARTRLSVLEDERKNY